MLQRSFCSRVDVGAERHTDRRHGRVLERLGIHRLTREVSVSRESLCGLLVEVLRKKATLCGSYVRKVKYILWREKASAFNPLEFEKERSNL